MYWLQPITLGNEILRAESRSMTVCSSILSAQRFSQSSTMSADWRANQTFRIHRDSWCIWSTTRRHKKSPASGRGFIVEVRSSIMRGDDLHHAAHTTHVGHRRSSRFILWRFRHHGFCGQQQTGHRGRILQCCASDLGRVDDAELDQLAIFAGRSVISKIAAAFGNLVQDYRSIFAGVGNNLPQRLFEGTTQNVNTDRLVIIRTRQLSLNAARARINATPPPGTTPSSTAARSNAKRLQRGLSSLSSRSRLRRRL